MNCPFHVSSPPTPPSNVSLSQLAVRVYTVHPFVLCRVCPPASPGAYYHGGNLSTGSGPGRDRWAQRLWPLLSRSAPACTVNRRRACLCGQRCAQRDTAGRGRDIKRDSVGRRQEAPSALPGLDKASACSGFLSPCSNACSWSCITLAGRCLGRHHGMTTGGKWGTKASLGRGRSRAATWAQGGGEHWIWAGLSEKP